MPRIAARAKLGSRINTVMQVCFFALAGVIPADDAIAEIKDAVEKTYAKRGPVVVERNFAAIDAALAGLARVKVPARLVADLVAPAGERSGAASALAFDGGHRDGGERRRERQRERPCLGWTG